MLQQQPRISYVALDSTESSATVRFHARQGLTVAAAMAGATDLRQRLDNISGCAFVEQSVVYPAVAPGAPAPAADSDGTRTGVLIFTTTDSAQYAIIEIPSIDDECLMLVGYAPGLDLNPGHPAVMALVTELTNGTWCNRFGYELVALEAAYLQIRHNADLYISR